METAYWDAETGWTIDADSVEDNLQRIRDDGRVEIATDRTAGGIRTITGECNGERFVLVGAAITAD